MKTLIIIGIFLLPLLTFAQTEKEILYVGTYSVRDSKGIYVFELNRAKGTLKLIQTIAGLPSPNYLELHPSGKYLYAVNSGGIDPNESAGSASAFSIQAKTGKLTLINHVSSYGRQPCHINIDKTGEWAFISNYNEGNFVVLPILQDGSLGALSDSKKYSGSSVNKFRQEQPHIHSAAIAQDNRHVYVSDLGTDMIYTYAIDLRNGRITPANKAETRVSPGSGPRHFTLHPSGKFAYSAQELSSTVATFRVDNGELKLLQDTVRSLPKEIKEINTSADIHTDPAGRFLYLSNRGADVLSIFSISKDGRITWKGVQKTMGKTPRNFLIDKKSKFVWVANQNSDNITVFRLNAKDGSLTYTGQSIKVPSPVCIKQLIIK